MTPTKPSQLLKAALDHLWDGTSPYNRERYICFALSGAREVSNAAHSLLQGTRELVLSRLHPYDSVETWLFFSKGTKKGYRGLVDKAGRRFLYRGYIPELDLQDPQNEAYFKQIQAYRKRWVKSLIKELKAKGR